MNDIINSQIVKLIFNRDNHVCYYSLYISLVRLNEFCLREQTLDETGRTG